MRCRETGRVVMATVYLSAFCTATLHTYLSLEEGRAQPTTEIESSIPLLPLQPPALVKPLPAEDLSKLNAIVREAIEKSPIQSKTVVGIHHALLNPSVVQQVLKSNPANSAPKVIIELPNKQSAVIGTDSLHLAQDSVMWKGHVEGAPGSRVRFIVYAKTNEINGSIEKGRFIYEIRPSPNKTNVLEILAIDPSGFPPEHGGLPPHHGSLRPPPASMSSVVGIRDDRVRRPLILTAGDSPPVIDVMILYTTAVRNQNPNIGATACQAVDDLKEALTNSGIQATARLVHHGIPDNFIEAPSASINENLESLRAAGNTPPVTLSGNTIYELRNTHAADVVSLWVSEANGTDCGMSPGLDANMTPYQNLAFSVVRLTCARSNRSFVHEVGHILQANHDRYWEEAGDRTDDNYGYVKADEGWMTVMSYQRPGCPLEDILDLNGVTQQRHACNRRLNWSNPSVSDPVTGDPMGRLAGFPIPPNACTDNQQQPPINCDGPADNARVLNNTVATVAGFRTGGSLGNVLCAPPDVTPPAPPIGLGIQ